MEKKVIYSDRCESKDHYERIIFDNYEIQFTKENSPKMIQAFCNLFSERFEDVVAVIEDKDYIRFLYPKSSHPYDKPETLKTGKYGEITKMWNGIYHLNCLPLSFSLSYWVMYHDVNF